MKSGPHHLKDDKASDVLQRAHQVADVVAVQQTHQVAAGLQQRHDDATEPRMHQLDSHTHDQTHIHARIQDIEAREAHVQRLLDDIRKREKEHTTQQQRDKCEWDTLCRQRDSEIEQRIVQIQAREDELQQLRQRILQREAELQLQHGQMLQRDVDVQLLRDEVSIREREVDMFRRKAEQCNAEMQLLRDEVRVHQDKLALKDRLEQGLCVVCMEKPADFAVIPCGHKCLCKVHADVMRQRNECPVCRASVHACFQIWPAGV